MKNKIEVKVKSLSYDALIPEYKSKGAAGFDLATIEDIFIPTNSIGARSINENNDDYDEDDEITLDELQLYLRNDNSFIAGTGLSFEIPEGYELEIRGRSGNAFKYRVFSFNGTIDSDYRGEVKLLLMNFGSESISFKKGERVAQGVIKKIEQVNFIEVSSLSETERGISGLGSTGL